MPSRGEVGPSLAGTRVLVTGAGGFLGSHMVERLVQEEAQVTALSRSEGRLSALAGGASSFIFVPCDLTDSRLASETIARFAPEILFHFASHPDGDETFAQARASFQANLLGTLNALEAFSRARGRLFVLADSCKVYGNGPVPYRETQPLQPRSSYAISKAAAWQVCELYAEVKGLATVAVRPTMIYGPRQAYNLISFVVDCVLEGKPEVRLKGGSQTRDPLYVDDAIDAFLAAARHGASLAGRAVNIGGGTEHTVADLAAAVVRHMGAHLDVVSVPERARPTEMWRSYCDNAEARECLGWRPCTSLDEGLERTIRSLVAARVDPPPRWSLPPSLPAVPGVRP
jgi:UDP-glucose 4-epimerase